MDKLQDFFNRYYNQHVDNKECVGLINQYRKELLGTPRMGVGSAYLMFNAAQADLYDKIKNSKTAVPQRGDIVIWNTLYGPHGHVAIATGKGDANTFEVLSQNDPLGSKCQYKTYRYVNSANKYIVTGWLRPKNKAYLELLNPVEPPKPEPQKVEEKIVYIDKPETLQRIKDLEFELDQVKQSNESLNKLVDDMNRDETDEKRIKQLEEELYKSQERVEELQNEIKTNQAFVDSCEANRASDIKHIERLDKALAEARILTEDQKKEIVIDYIKNLTKKGLKWISHKLGLKKQ